MMPAQKNAIYFDALTRTHLAAIERKYQRLLVSGEEITL
jgi:hypothetical protein